MSTTLAVLVIGSGRTEIWNWRRFSCPSITITDNRTGESMEIPIVNGGVSAEEWAKLLPGVWFFDPAFMSTAACESAITYLDGEAGILRYRAIPSSSWPNAPPTSKWPICS